MKLNKKGFTLFELLIVISFLVALGVTSTLSISKSMEKSKDERLNRVVKEIENAADVYIHVTNPNISENLYNCETTTCTINITYTSLQGALLIDNKIVNPKTNQKFSTNSYVQIVYDKNAENEKVTYEFKY